MMVLSREIVSDGLLDELDRFGSLVGGLTDAQWGMPTRCEGWSVGDVAAHLIGTMADVAAGRLDGLGTPEVTQREVDERKGRTPAQLATECAETRAAAAAMLPAFDDATWDSPAPGGYDGTLGEAVEALWYDAYVHADDIRAAIGEPTEPGPGLGAATSHVVNHLEKLGWSGEIPDGEGAAHGFVLAATGRADRPESLPNIYA
jgi:uncharacterized protein (TIGR03083 family)